MTDSLNKVLKPSDFASDQDIRWCPGCGDFAILKQMQIVLPRLNVPKKDIVFVSGIGCSSRFPYYMNTYGIHTIHGRAAAIATGLKLSRPELSVWIVTGDGDCLSIGGNHFIHLLRRNPNVNLLLFNNQIYGLTKGQFSPTSELDKVTKSSPWGTADKPFNPLALAMGADGSFLARTIDREAKHLQEMISRSHAHLGSSVLEIYQNCNIFNDGAFRVYTDRDSRKLKTLFVKQGEPLTFGQNAELGIRLDGMTPQVVHQSEVSSNDLWIHDETDPIKAQLLIRFGESEWGLEDFPKPFGVLFAKERPVFEQLNEQLNERAVQKRGKESVQQLLNGDRTWQVT